ncbi:MAG TPA: hypothetical protein VMG37_11655 [Solirubrobacteraceae bacterium]|nr:hypothetical protein [Solirubrobacteraceae bacterium]
MAATPLHRWSPDSDSLTVAIRLAERDEAAALRRLAALDDQRPLDGPVLVALVDGEPEAAISLDSRRVIANPFLATRDLVQLLRVRAEHLAGPDPRRGRHTLLRRAA